MTSHELEKAGNGAHQPVRDEKPGQFGEEFARFLDPQWMRDLFQQRLPGFSQRERVIRSCAIGHTKYKSFKRPESRNKSYIAVSYTLEISTAGRPDNQILYVKAYIDGRSRQEYEKNKTKQLTGSDYGQPLIHLPDLDMVIWSFPNDPVLDQLPALTDPDSVKGLLPYTRLGDYLRDPEEIVEVTPQVVNYRPEKRCLIRYLLRLREESQRRRLVLYGKTFKDDFYQEIHKRIEWFWRHSSQGGGAFYVAHPLGCSAAVKTVWQHAVPGVPLHELIDRKNFSLYLEMVAAGLASLHQSPLSSPLILAPAYHLAEVKKKSIKLKLAFPKFTTVLDRILVYMEKVYNRVCSVRLLIHNDFHLRQLAYYDHRIALFDFDEFAMGDPAQDIASFVVDLNFYDFSRETVAAMSDQFVRAYRTLASHYVSDENINWYVNMQLITKAYRCYKQQLVDKEQEIARILSFVSIL